MNIKTSMRNLVCALAMIPALALAHGGEDHSDDARAKATPGKTFPVMVGSESPARLPDGSVFLPKASQNLLDVRTVMTALGEVSETIELKGRVKADPSAGGQVQAPQMGRIVAHGAGLPALGQRVKAGQVLAWLEPVVGSIERGNQQAQLAQIRGQLAQAERRVARYAQLEGSVPQKEIDAAVSELQALRQQKAALDGGLTARQPLSAPASGVLSNVAVVAGQVVDAKEVIFTVVDPQRLIVEALAYDARLIGNIANVSGMTEEGSALTLHLVGTGLELREQALPVQLRIAQPAPPLAVGQPVKVFARLATTRRGVVIPSTAAVRAPSGELVVWLHTAAERFVPHKVQVRALDAASVVVTQGLAGGERVVVQGVPALAQVR